MSGNRIIIGQVITEKAETQKHAARRVYSLRVVSSATKVDVLNELQRLYDVEVGSIRVMRIPAKTRMLAGNRTMKKRHHYKKALVTLKKESKPLDLATFKV